MKFGRNSLLLLAAAVGLPAVDAHCGGTPPERRTLQRRSASLGKRAECGPGVGSCPPGQCCSDAGNCGTDEDYCDGASCQLDYSDSCDTFHSPPGASTANIARPKIGSVPYGTVITSCTTPGTVALTFDDGPWIYTSQILDVLDQLGIKATFFIVGNNLGKTEMDSSATSWPAILQRMHNAGHQMASHTWTHRDLELVNTTIQNTEIIYNEMAFRNIFGFFPTYFRAPYLDCESDCLLLLNSFGYHVIDQNIDTKDYENDDPTLIQTSKNTFANALSSKPATHSYIELSHDIHYQTVVNLTQFMYQTSIAKGYKLTTVGECLGDPPANWYRSAGGSGSSTSVSTTKSTSVSTTKSTSVSTSKSTSVSTTKSTSVSSTKTSTSATSTSTLKLSPDQTCGGTTGYTCQGSQWGNCCSFYGWCGSTTDYCGTGCQSAFGTCSSAGTGIGNTTNGLCGSAYGTTCLYYGTKTCCSQFGYCGSTSAYCGTGCQTKYGKCT